MAQPHTTNDGELDPKVNPPRSSRPWLAMIEDAEKTFNDWQETADRIDALYADLGKLSNNTRDRAFQLFWANIQVMGPSIYSRPPVPVVVPKFKDRRPLYRVSSELLERCCIVSFDATAIDDVMRLLRDDLTVVGRGVPWVRYETKAESDTPTERVTIDHLDRKDFLHEPARSWAEVGWVARRGWMTRDAMKKRFADASDGLYLNATMESRRDDREAGGSDGREKAGVWEIWHRPENKVVWIAEGCDEVLDEGEPHLTLEGFFPCPRPVFATTQRRSLIPVPDMVYYRDQLEEINELTGRIHALSEAIKVRGFYPSGATEIGDAVEAALKAADNRSMLVPISNWAAFGQGNGDPIIWLPMDMIARTVGQLIELRKALIDDVYQIMGLSDIMRGSTNASETLGAQELKSQYGSIRIRDKQAELVRVARDLVRIVAEIMAENFAPKTLADMCQMEIETDADVRKQAEGIRKQAQAQLDQQVQQALQDPEAAQQAQENPDAAQQMLAQAREKMAAQVETQVEALKDKPTLEKVTAFLRDQKTRPFVLDIETDSTIAPDENAAKQRAAEFVTAIGGFMGQAFPLLQADPSAAPVVADVLKYVSSQYRAGRAVETSIEEFAEAMKQRASNPQPQPDPAAEAMAAKAKADQEATAAKMQMDQQRHEAEMALKKAEFDGRAQEAQIRDAQAQTDEQGKAAERQARLQEIAANGEAQAQRHRQEMERGVLTLDKLRLEIDRMNAQAEQAQMASDAEVLATLAPAETDGAIA